MESETVAPQEHFFVFSASGMVANFLMNLVGCYLKWLGLMGSAHQLVLCFVGLCCAGLCCWVVYRILMGYER